MPLAAACSRSERGCFLIRLGAWHCLAVAVRRHHIRELLPLDTIVENNYDYDRCGNLVSEEYRKLSGTNQAGAMLSYMKIVQQLPR